MPSHVLATALASLPVPRLSHTAVALGCGYLAGSIGLVRQAPQLWRTCVQRQTAGLSALTSFFGLLNSCTWLGYGLLADAQVQVGVNGVFLLVNGALTMAIVAGSPLLARSRSYLGAAGLALVWGSVLLAHSVSGAEAIAVCGALLGTACGLPQLAVLAGKRRAYGDGGDTSGIARSTWRLGALCCLLWAAHGLLIGSLAVTVPALWNLLVAVLVLGLLGPADPKPAGPAAATDDETAPIVLPRQRTRPASLPAPTELICPRA